MKNKFVIYCCATLGLLTVVVAANYICYRSAIKQFTEQQKFYEQQLSNRMENQLASRVDEKFEEAEQEQDIPVANTDEKLNVDTIYQVENYDAQKDQTTTEYLTLPEKLVGYTREETDEYFKNYMKNMDVEEFLNGLQSIGVSTFSDERLIVHKVYDSSKVEYRYYIIAVDGEVVVYYGDKKTIYEYTGISVDSLSEEEQAGLKQGVEVKDENELFGVLENYSS